MTSAPASHEVICPHCKKRFRGELLEGRDERHRGFRCTYCRLFIPYKRADEQDLIDPAE